MSKLKHRLARLENRARALVNGAAAIFCGTRDVVEAQEREASRQGRMPTGSPILRVIIAAT